MAKYVVEKDAGFGGKHVVARSDTAEKAAAKRLELRQQESRGSSASFTVRKGKR